jgi:hypothetical protein
MKQIFYSIVIALTLTACTTNEALRDNKHGTIQSNLSRSTMRDGRFVTSDTNAPGGARNWREWKLEPTKNARTPYWIIQVPPAIIDDHGGIWSDNAQALMAAIFRMNFPIVAKSERGVEKQATPALFQMPLAPTTKQATPRH